MHPWVAEHWLPLFDRLATEDHLVLDGVFDADILQALETSLHGHLTAGDLHKAGIGALADHQVDTTVRGDEVHWLDRGREQDLEPFFQRMEELLALLNRYCYLSLSGWEFHFAHYPPGTFYKRHRDQFRGRGNRLISVVLYLNRDRGPGDGGELRLFLPDEERLVEPLYGRLVLFKSDVLEHEVLPTRTDRYSLTGWLLHQPPGLGFLG